MPGNFEEMIRQIPDEQRQLLERMMELGLVKSFGTNKRTGQWAVIYTKTGRGFLDLVRKVVASRDSSRRLSRLAALDMLADGEGTFCGFAEE
jgi:hypothetical protein